MHSSQQGKSKIVIECLLYARHWGYSNEEGRDAGVYNVVKREEEIDTQIYNQISAMKGYQVSYHEED